MENTKCNILDILSRGTQEGQSKKENARGQHKQKVGVWG